MNETKATKKPVTKAGRVKLERQIQAGRRKFAEEVEFLRKQAEGYMPQYWDAWGT